MWTPGFKSASANTGVDEVVAVQRREIESLRAQLDAAPTDAQPRDEQPSQPGDDVVQILDNDKVVQQERQKLIELQEGGYADIRP